MNAHSLLDDLVHSGHTDPHLILKKLANASETTVAKMVDIVGLTDSVSEVEEIVYRSEYIFLSNMLGAKSGNVFLNALLYECNS